jgi:hypothetical protein
MTHSSTAKSKRFLRTLSIDIWVRNQLRKRRHIIFASSYTYTFICVKNYKTCYGFLSIILPCRSLAYFFPERKELGLGYYNSVCASFQFGFLSSRFVVMKHIVKLMPVSDIPTLQFFTPCKLLVLVNDQLDPQFFTYMFISILYVFQATSCSSSGKSIVSIHLLCVILCKWPSSMQVLPDLHTRRSPTQWHIPDVVLIQLILLMMSTRLLETCREVK